ncbi:MAG: ATP-binding protein [Gemmatimonadetes bacterium]|nr:ATP-binding protein [Gemmatimonadota bacterium]
MRHYDRLVREPKGSYFLLGPRGTGKSSLLSRRHPDGLRIDLLDAAVERELSARPERLLDLVAPHPRDQPVVLDEVQRVPELLNAVHQLIERDRRRFVLSGSSARKLRRAGTNLLGGRAAMTTLGPFLAAELGDDFSLDDALRVGLIPLILASPEPERALRDYAGLYVREEVRAEALVRSHGDFSRFLEVIAFSHASPVNISDIARDCAITRRTAEGYLGVLEDLLLGARLPPFTRGAVRATIAHPKFYYFDAGLYQSLLPAGPLDRPSEAGGAALEGIVVQHLRAWASDAGDHTVSFWRTRTGLEVDIVLYGPEEFIAVEVKLSRTVKSSDLSGLRAFGTDYPEAKRFVLARGARSEEVDGIRILPVAEALKRVRPGESITNAWMEP